VPAIIALVGSRGGSSRAGALAINGLVVFAGASCGPLAAQLPISFAGLMLSLAALLMIASGLVAISNRPKGRCHRLETPAVARQTGQPSSAGACWPFSERVALRGASR
jgi:cytochrome c oxidase assembly factor CtaG